VFIDIALAEVAKEKKLSYVKAWEKSEKTKADNKYEYFMFFFLFAFFHCNHKSLNQVTLQK
jgi:hypothetical protein